MIWPFNKEEKKHPAGSALLIGSGNYSGKINNAKSYVEEGYQGNSVVYRAINEIATAAACIDVELWDGDNLVEQSPALDLLNNPNPMQGKDTFIKNVFIDWLTTGEIFISRTSNNKELWPLSPLKMKVVEGSGGIPEKYVFGTGKDEKVFPVKAIDASSQVFFHKFYNPQNYWRGMSPLQAAAVAADSNNAGLKWNYSLLKNSGRPSGVIQFEGSPSDQTVSRLTEFFKSRVQGENNAGEIPMLEGGAKWQQMDNSPRDMDFNNILSKTDLYIAMVYGVPLPLISNDAATFNNLEQAKERLYTDTVLPLFQEFLDSFGKWLLPKFGDNLKFKPDLDTIPALEGIRQKKYDRAESMVKAGILSPDEARELIGYDSKGGVADDLFINSTQIPMSLSGFSDVNDTMKALGYSESEIKSIE